MYYTILSIVCEIINSTVNLKEMDAKFKDRLSRAEGQIKGVKNKLGKQQLPRAFVQQVKAARNAIHEVGEEALQEYYREIIVHSQEPGKVFDEYVACSKKLRL